MKWATMLWGLTRVYLQFQLILIMVAREEIIDWEKECTICERRKAKRAKQIMALLPLIQLKPSLKVFLRTALDFAGLFVAIQKREREYPKSYLCLFTCPSTTAVHLEMAYSLDTHYCLRVLCGMCKDKVFPRWCTV